MEEKRLNKDFEKFLEAARNLLELTEQIKNCDNPSLKELYISLADALETEIVEAFESYKTHLEESGCTVGEYLIKLKPFIGVLKAYEEAKKGKPAEQHDELTEEIQELLKINETEETILDDSPLLKAITRNGVEVANYGEAGQIKIIEKDGSLNPYHAAVFSTAIKAFVNNKVTKAGNIVITENKAIKTMLGLKGTPSKKQKEDFKQAWEDMRNESMTYETTESIAQIIGVEQEELEDFIPNLEPSSTTTVEEYFLQGVKIIKNQTVEGKTTDVYLIKPADIVTKLLGKFHWYEEIEPELQRVLKEDDNGNLLTWGYSKQRIALQNYIYSWVYKNKRARVKGKKRHPLKLAYEKIFEECNLDVSHRQSKARRLEDIAVILEHLKRCEVIADWREYNSKVETARGIEIILYKERLE